MAMSFEERVEQYNDMVHDPDLALTGKEFLELTYHWMRLEYSIIRLNRQAQRVEKHTKWLNDITEIYNLRKALADQ